MTEADGSRPIGWFDLGMAGGRMVYEAGQQVQSYAQAIGSRAVEGAVGMAQSGAYAVAERVGGWMAVNPRDLRHAVQASRLDEDVRTVEVGLANKDPELTFMATCQLSTHFGEEVVKHDLSSEETAALAADIERRTGLVMPGTPEEAAELLPDELPPSGE